LAFLTLPQSITPTTPEFPAIQRMRKCLYAKHEKTASPKRTGGISLYKGGSHKRPAEELSGMTGRKTGKGYHGQACSPAGKAYSPSIL
jgi:hypothetical protein